MAAPTKTPPDRVVGGADRVGEAAADQAKTRIQTVSGKICNAAAERATP